MIIFNYIPNSIFQCPGRAAQSGDSINTFVIIVSPQEVCSAGGVVPPGSVARSRNTEAGNLLPASPSPLFTSLLTNITIVTPTHKGNSTTSQGQCVAGSVRLHAMEVAVKWGVTIHPR